MMNDDVFMFKHSATSGILDDQVLKQRNTYFVLLQLLVYNLLFYFRLLVLFSVFYNQTNTMCPKSLCF